MGRWYRRKRGVCFSRLDWLALDHVVQVKQPSAKLGRLAAARSWVGFFFGFKMIQSHSLHLFVPRGCLYKDFVWQCGYEAGQKKNVMTCISCVTRIPVQGNKSKSILHGRLWVACWRQFPSIWQSMQGASDKTRPQVIKHVLVSI